MTMPILMPALSPTMTEGTLARWLKAEGDAVTAGDIIAEIETDKATMEVEVVDDGVLGKIVVAEGTEGVAVNSVIAVMLEDGEDAAALKDAQVQSVVADEPEPDDVSRASTRRATRRRPSRRGPNPRSRREPR